MDAELVHDVGHAELVDVGVSLYRSDDPATQLAEAQAKAQVLTEFVVSQSLAKRLSKRKDARPYVQVEGWQFLASMLGLTVVVEWSRPLHDSREPEWEIVKKEGKDVRRLVTPGRGGWEARAVATHLASGTVMGAGEAECRWTEQNWRDRDSYALRSMAQTRATSKALRGPLAFVMVLAGFAATPAEEMDGIVEDEDPRRCPACGAGVWDNVARRADGWGGPAFKCRSKTCTGVTTSGEKVTAGKPGEPWCTWDEAYFTEARRDVEHGLSPEEYLAAVRVEPDTGEARNALWAWLVEEAGGDKAEASRAWQDALSDAGVDGDQTIPWDELVPLIKRAGEYAREEAAR